MISLYPSQTHLIQGRASQPVYFDAPTFAANSNGIRCIYYLAKKLASNGVQVIFLPRSPRGFKEKLPIDFINIKASPLWDVNGPAMLICSESVPAKTIKCARRNGLRIVWWYLAPHGLLDKPKITPIDGEKVIAFSVYAAPQENTYYYFQPPLDPPWKKAIETYRPKTNHKRLEVALYCGKGRLKALPKNITVLLFNSNIRVITREHPQTRKELFDLMLSIDGLITFDELSQLSLEAATLGLPVFLANPLFSPESLELFPIPIARLITRDSNYYIDLLASKRRGELKAVSQNEIFSRNTNCVTQILELVSSANWNSTSDDQHRLDKIIRFGHELRASSILYPHYSGQSAGAFLLGVYTISILERPFIHRLTCLTISLLDEVGHLFFRVGGSALFISLASRFKGSKILRRALKSMRTFIN